MSKRSAGLLAHKIVAGKILVLLVHPGGPFWRNKDQGVWTIPKGEIADGEDPLAAARREFREETGQDAGGEVVALTPIRRAGGKVVEAWAIAADIAADAIVSNQFEIEWPPRSGRRQSFPEADRAAWLPLPEARQRINKGQTALLDELELLLHRAGQ